MVIDKDNINKDFRDTFNIIYKDNRQNVAFQEKFYNEDEKYFEELLTDIKPSVNTLMNNMIWIMEHPELFDNKKLFGSLCNINFTQNGDTKILTIGDNPLYLKSDNTGYTLCVDNREIEYDNSYLKFCKIFYPDNVKFFYDTVNLAPEDKYKSLSQIHAQSASRFFGNKLNGYYTWKENIEKNIETSIEILEIRTKEMTDINYNSSKIVDIKEIDDNKIIANLYFKIGLEHGSYICDSRLTGKAALVLDKEKSKLTITEITIGKTTKLNDNEAYYVSEKLMVLEDIFKEQMFEGIEDSKENDDIER